LGPALAAGCLPVAADYSAVAAGCLPVADFLLAAVQLKAVGYPAVAADSADFGWGGSR
jgi:hypothetical protein